jgi:hypothetical protein
VKKYLYDYNRFVSSLLTRIADGWTGIVLHWMLSFSICGILISILARPFKTYAENVLHLSTIRIAEIRAAGELPTDTWHIIIFSLVFGIVVIGGGIVLPAMATWRAVRLYRKNEI